MSLKSMIKTNKYMNKIYLWIAVGMIVVLMIFGTISYFYVSNSIIDQQNIADKKTLSQIKYNIDYMDQVITAVCFNLYYNPSVKNLVNDENLDFGDIMQQINDIKTSVVNTNPYIQSVYIYNSQSKKYYTTQDEMMFDDRSLDELIQYYKVVPKLVPLYRRIYINNNKNLYLDVVSYFLYEYKNELGKPDGAIIVNCKTDWLINNIKKLNMTSENNDSIYVMDNNGDFIGNGDDAEFEAALKSNYRDYIRKNPDKSTGYFKSVINNKNYMISFDYVEKAQWVLFKAQPVSQIFQNLNRLRNAFILMTLAFIILALIISITAARSIYKPIGSLVKQIRKSDPQTQDVQQVDEITLLKKFYYNTVDILEQYKKEKKSNSSILKAYFLRRILVDSYSVPGDEWKKAARDYALAISDEKQFVICLLRIDDYKSYIHEYNNEDRELYRFAIINIASEVMAQEFKLETVDLKNDQIVMIVNIDNSMEDPYSKIKACLVKAQENVMKYYNLQLSAAVSSTASSIGELSGLYSEAVNYSSYRFVYGRMSIITLDMVKHNIDNQQVGYDLYLEKKLVNEIRIANLDGIEAIIDAILKDISKQSYNNMLLSVMQMINAVKAAVDEMNTQSKEPVFVDAGNLAVEVFDETMEELTVKVMEYIKAVVSRAGSVENEKQLALAETVKDIINANYFDSRLYLPEIASKMNLSPKHVARVFKSVTKMSVNDYINDIRLNKAIEWLENSKLSIHEIICKIGIDNESYFYKLFKTKYGMTPREYVIHLTAKSEQ